MNQPLPHDDRLFDRLVDGELTDAEYRALLASLDEEPGGWRRCAMSFLEAQALERDLGSLRRQRVEPTPPPSTISTAQRGGANLGRPWVALAMAASFLMAFGLGMAIRHDWSPDAGGASQIAENNSPTTKPNDAQVAATSGGKAESGSLRSPLADERNQPLGNVTLVVDGQGPAQQQRVEVPVYELDQLGEDYFTVDQSVLPPEIQQELQRRGHELRRHRQLVPLQLENGRQAVFPMEEVEIVPARAPAF